ncbi:MAG: metal-dependent transcriptional regulator [Ignavibacteriaceae bacterium]|nr:metal-dependent transcriptional regulator [Ignavibacteriaceae bacterium]
MPTVSKEDYIKAIYNTKNSGNGTATTSGIAEKLDVSKAATSEMVQKLSDLGLVDYEKYKGMSLTSEGERVALQILRRHRIWEMFLIEVLGLSWSEVHDEAERLEHSTSDFLIDKIEEFLGFPKFDPHGSPIPNKNFELPDAPLIYSLNEVSIGFSYKISRVLDKSNELMKYFTKIGVALHKEVFVKEILSFDGSVVIQIDGNEITISQKTAGYIFVCMPEGGAIG